ncbi:hypothetical protein L9F63_027044, partial [Diploptera punctata]
DHLRFFVNSLFSLFHVYIRPFIDSALSVLSDDKPRTVIGRKFIDTIFGEQEFNLLKPKSPEILQIPDVKTHLAYISKVPINHQKMDDSLPNDEITLFNFVKHVVLLSLRWNMLKIKCYIKKYQFPYTL